MNQSPHEKTVTLGLLFEMAREISEAKGLEGRDVIDALIDLFNERDELEDAWVENNFDLANKDSVPSEFADCMWVLINIARQVGMTPKDIEASLWFKYHVALSGTDNVSRAERGE